MHHYINICFNYAYRTKWTQCRQKGAGYGILQSQQSMQRDDEKLQTAATNCSWLIVSFSDRQWGTLSVTRCSLPTIRFFQICRFSYSSLTPSNYRLLAILLINEVAKWETPCPYQPQPATANGVRDGRSNWLAVTSSLSRIVTPERHKSVSPPWVQPGISNTTSDATQAGDTD